MFADTPQKLLQTTFEGLYNFDLQCEGGRDHWITLQGDMTVNPQNPATHPLSIRLCLADKSQKHTAAHQFLMRYPDAHAPKAKGTLKSLVPTLAKNSGYYPDTRVDAQKNVKLITRDLTAKGYPNTWWAPLLHKCLKKCTGIAHGGYPLVNRPIGCLPNCMLACKDREGTQHYVQRHSL